MTDERAISGVESGKGVEWYVLESLKRQEVNIEKLSKKLEEVRDEVIALRPVAERTQSAEDSHNDLKGEVVVLASRIVSSEAKLDKRIGKIEEGRQWSVKVLVAIVSAVALIVSTAGQAFIHWATGGG